MYVCFLFALLCGFTAGLSRQHFFLDMSMNWTNAQQHCRQHYKDLSSIPTAEEYKAIKKLAGDNPPLTWIGLYRSHWFSDQWLWSDKEPYSSSWWQIDQPNKYDRGQHCTGTEAGGWNDYYCWNKLPFFCERILVLVKENKTWLEAYEHCRSHYTGLAYLSSENMDLAEKETQDTQTESVWTGLRFLAGEWLWVNGTPLEELVSLPPCPNPANRCGALNTMDKDWENRHCEEKLNFLCY